MVISKSIPWILDKSEDEWKSMVTLLPALKVKFDPFSSTLSADGTYNHTELQQEFDKIQEKNAAN